MSDCIFCKIAAGDIPSARVLETDELVAFLDIGPVNKGHTLLVPKAHHETLDQTPPELMAKMGEVLPRLAGAVAHAANADGYNVHQSNGECAGQVVPHVHVHIIPRFEGDGFVKHWEQGQYEGDEMARMQEAIKSRLDA